MNVDRLRGYAGLAAAIVPCALIVHLVAEAAALGSAGLGAAFVLRHAYFGILIVAAAGWFGVTIGIGCSRSERRRRCSLLGADLRGRHGRHGIVTLIGANLGLFALTQLVEGVPIAAGAAIPSLAIALAGSVGAALLVFYFGQTIALATLASVIGSTPRRAAQRTFSFRARAIVVPRRATAIYTLNRPNRPPPFPSQF